MSLADNLKKLRNALNLTQEQVSNDLKINRATYAHYETGRREPDIEMLKSLAEYYNISTDQLLSSEMSLLEIKSDFGQMLRNLREEKGLSQVDLAKQLNITSQSLSQYELNKRMPDIDMISRLADYFNVSVDYLLGRTDIRKPLNESVKDLQSNITFEDLEMLKEIHKLSPESQHEIKKLIELYKIKDMQDRNTEFSDEISGQD